MLLSKHNDVLFILLNMKCTFDLLCTIDGLACSHIDEFYIGLGEAKTSLKGEFLDIEDLWIVVLIEKILLKVANVLYLTWLSYSVAFFLESPLSIKLHYLFIVIEYSHKQKEATNYCSCSTLPVVTVKNCYSFRISCQKVSYFVTNHKQSVKGWSFVIFPLETDHIA